MASNLIWSLAFQKSLMLQALFLFDTTSLTPHYRHLNTLKFPDIVRLYTCLFLYDLLCNAKSSNFITLLLSEQHSYASRIVSSDLLYIPFSRTNIRKFCPIGRCYRSVLLERSTSFYSFWSFKTSLQECSL